MNLDDAKTIATKVWWHISQRDAVLLLIGTLIGGLIGWYFYVESGKELAAETKRLRELHNYTLVMLQNMQAGHDVISTVERDSEGNPTGIGVTAHGANLTGTGIGSGGSSEMATGTQQAKNIK